MVSKTDLSAAFRNLGISPKDWSLLVMKAHHPITGQVFYFVDKCLPFGHSISCALFQAVSDAISHIATIKLGRDNVNYLDDFFFGDLVESLCNLQIEKFLEICAKIKFPVAVEKTHWATTRLVFLGLLIDTVLQKICVPIEKIKKLLEIIQWTLERKKITLKALQSLCGHLNFVCKAVIPGRTFTRRLYFATAGKHLRPYHHIRMSKQIKDDLRMWEVFLQEPTAYCRPFLDLSLTCKATNLHWYTDAAKAEKLGCGGVCGDQWFKLTWEKNFITKHNPSIAFLELYGVTVSIYHWLKFFPNRRIILYCDNMSVVHMINKNTSNCKHCLVLIRLIVLASMKINSRVFARHVIGKTNKLADYLSRNKMAEFRLLAKGRFNNANLGVHRHLWPASKLYLNV